MARKRLKFDKQKEVKAIARKRVGSPPPARALDERAVRRKPKHKKRLTKEGSNLPNGSMQEIET